MNNNKNLSREAEIIKKKNAQNVDSKTEKYNIWNRKIEKLTVDSAIKRMKFCILLQHGWTWRVLCLVK